MLTLAVYTFVMGPYFIALFTTGGSVSFLFPTLLQSCTFVVNFINKSVLLPKTLKRLFDKVINRKMQIKYNKLPQGVLKAYLPGYYGESLKAKFVRYVLTTMGPLFWVTRLGILFLINMIPIAGPVLVILIKAPTSGFNKHRRYFHLKGYSNGQIHYIWKRKSHFYFAYGVVALSLEAIPFANILFTFTNTVGAALWAIDIERRMTKELVAALHAHHVEIDKDLTNTICNY